MSAIPLWAAVLACQPANLLTINGTVTDTDGETWASTEVNIDAWPDAQFEPMSQSGAPFRASTNDGHFSIEVDPGAWLLAATTDGHNGTVAAEGDAGDTVQVELIIEAD